MRVISWFSCGAASAVATVLAAIQRENVHAVYCRVRNEHVDNLRFLDDFTRTFRIPVEVICNEEFDGQIYNVFLKRKFIKNQFGAPCTMLLKKEMRRRYQHSDDIQVFGYTSEEQDRADAFLDSNNEVSEWFPLIENGIDKRFCLDLIRQSGIELPIMYRLGYQNNNCIGCIKGGIGYWNKIRKDFPEAFDKMAKLERTIGHAVCKDNKGAVYLDELAPKRGRFKTDQPRDCGFTCEAKT
jgi:3'-phosphoadenosine 5'-phosphosulfate sulfotransferase (PAPS reductase)/FAD synthetase